MLKLAGLSQKKCIMGCPNWHVQNQEVFSVAPKTYLYLQGFTQNHLQTNSNHYEKNCTFLRLALYLRHTFLSELAINDKTRKNPI
jgi:hypothetical protein